MNLTGKNKYRFRVKELRKDFPSNWSSKQTGLAILIYDKADIKPKLEDTKQSHRIDKGNISAGENNNYRNIYT
jgi:hypothetical protein